MNKYKKGFPKGWKPSLTTPTQKLREEFKVKFGSIGNPDILGLKIPSNEIADWWLAKRTAELEEIQKEIKAQQAIDKAIPVAEPSEIISIREER